MADKSEGIVAKVLQTECRPTVEVAIPSGTPFVEVISNPDRIIDVVRRLGPRGCEMCLSGRDILIRERFDDVIQVEFERPA